ncbi:hypothetical protein EDB89DRAFT_1922364 [Lactarius sanguifluus]|nr:hypothetical protein EDB89DRAFT_1922364 [Lactarius sanguifluus]
MTSYALAIAKLRSKLITSLKCSRLVILWCVILWCVTRPKPPSLDTRITLHHRQCLGALQSMKFLASASNLESPRDALTLRLQLGVEVL